MITMGFLRGILTRVGSVFTALLMQCCSVGNKLWLTENDNRKCKLFIL